MLQIQLPLRTRNLESQTAVLHVSVALIAAGLAEDLTARFESEHFVNWCFLLVGYHEPLHGRFMGEARLDELVDETDQELLSIFLAAELVGGHDLSHERLNEFCIRSAGLVSRFQIFRVSTE